jgi:hypothetical protein
VCEAPDAPQLFGASTACGGAFAFGLQYDLVAAAKGNTGALAKVAAYHQTAPAGMASFLSNHDSFAGQRLWDQVGGNQAQYKLAAAMNLLLPGRPFIYYGEEIGMGGNTSLSGDWALRTPMSWTADQSGFTSGTPWRALASNVATQNVAASADPASIRAFYRACCGCATCARPSPGQPRGAAGAGRRDRLAAPAGHRAQPGGDEHRRQRRHGDPSPSCQPWPT